MQHVIDAEQTDGVSEEQALGGLGLCGGTHGLFSAHTGLLYQDLCG